MKHLLILLISILLLSSPVIGEETGVLYQYETSIGIEWKTSGDGKAQPNYKAEIKKGEMDGLGVLTYPYDGKSIVGEWKDGKKHGQGTFTFPFFFGLVFSTGFPFVIRFKSSS